MGRLIIGGDSTQDIGDTYLNAQKTAKDQWAAIAQANNDAAKTGIAQQQANQQWQESQRAADLRDQQLAQTGALSREEMANRKGIASDQLQAELGWKTADRDLAQKKLEQEGQYQQGELANRNTVAENTAKYQTGELANRDTVAQNNAKYQADEIAQRAAANELNNKTRQDSLDSQNVNRQIQQIEREEDSPIRAAQAEKARYEATAYASPEGKAQRAAALQAAIDRRNQRIASVQYGKSGQYLAPHIGLDSSFDPGTAGGQVSAPDQEADYGSKTDNPPLTPQDAAPTQAAPQASMYNQAVQPSGPVGGASEDNERAAYEQKIRQQKIGEQNKAKIQKDFDSGAIDKLPYSEGSQKVINAMKSGAISEEDAQSWFKHNPTKNAIDMLTEGVNKGASSDKDRLDRLEWMEAKLTGDLQSHQNNPYVKQELDAAAGNKTKTTSKSHSESNTTGYSAGASFNGLPGLGLNRYSSSSSSDTTGERDRTKAPLDQLLQFNKAEQSARKDRKEDPAALLDTIQQMRQNILDQQQAPGKHGPQFSTPLSAEDLQKRSAETDAANAPITAGSVAKFAGQNVLNSNPLFNAGKNMYDVATGQKSYAEGVSDQSPVMGAAYDYLTGKQSAVQAVGQRTPVAASALKVADLVTNWDQLSPQDKMAKSVQLGQQLGQDAMMVYSGVEAIKNKLGGTPPAGSPPGTPPAGGTPPPPGDMPPPAPETPPGILSRAKNAVVDKVGDVIENRKLKADAQKLSAMEKVYGPDSDIVQGQRAKMAAEYKANNPDFAQSQGAAEVRVAEGPGVTSTSGSPVEQTPAVDPMQAPLDAAARNHNYKNFAEMQQRNPDLAAAYKGSMKLQAAQTAGPQGPAAPVSEVAPARPNTPPASQAELVPNPEQQAPRQRRPWPEVQSRNSMLADNNMYGDESGGGMQTSGRLQAQPDQGTNSEMLRAQIDQKMQTASPQERATLQSALDDLDQRAADKDTLQRMDKRYAKAKAAPQSEFQMQANGAPPPPPDAPFNPNNAKLVGGLSDQPAPAGMDSKIVTPDEFEADVGRNPNGPNKSLSPSMAGQTADFGLPDLSEKTQLDRGGQIAKIVKDGGSSVPEYDDLPQFGKSDAMIKASVNKNMTPEQSASLPSGVDMGMLDQQQPTTDRTLSQAGMKAGDVRENGKLLNPFGGSQGMIDNALKKQGSVNPADSNVSPVLDPKAAKIKKMKKKAP